MIFTNIIVTVILSLQTNTVEHWPRKWEPEQGLHYHAWNDSGGKWVSRGGMLTQEWGAEVPDTNADTKTIETTVVLNKSASGSYEELFFRGETNEVKMHYSVDMQRVSTNSWVKLWSGDDIETWKTLHDFAELVKLDVFGINSLTSPRYTLAKMCPTNYFVPVKTNWLGSLEIHGGYWEAATNYFYEDYHASVTLTNDHIGTNDWPKLITNWKVSILNAGSTNHIDYTNLYLPCTNKFFRTDGNGKLVEVPGFRVDENKMIVPVEDGKRP